MVRWLRWHCPPDTGLEIRALVVWGRARYLSVTEAPHNTNFHTWMGKKQFCFFQTAETGNRTPDSGVKGSGANHYPRAPALQRAGPQTTHWRLVSLWAECCTTVCDAGPALKQHSIGVSRLLELQLLFQLVNLAQVTADHCEHARLVQWWAFACKTGPTLKQHYANAIKLPNLAFIGLIGRASLDKLPLFKSHSIHTMNGFQPTCNALTRHSNGMKITPPPLLAFKCNYCRICNR